MMHDMTDEILVSMAVRVVQAEHDRDVWRTLYEQYARSTEDVQELVARQQRYITGWEQTLESRCKKAERDSEYWKKRFEQVVETVRESGRVPRHEHERVLEDLRRRNEEIARLEFDLRGLNDTCNAQSLRIEELSKDDPMYTDPLGEAREWMDKYEQLVQQHHAEQIAQSAQTARLVNELNQVRDLLLRLHTMVQKYNLLSYDSSDINRDIEKYMNEVYG